LVLFLLVVLWAGAGVYYFKGRPETRSADSIGSFRHQLRVLERTSPTVIDPAHRLVDAPAPLRLPLAGAGMARSIASTPATAAARRRQTLKRRRDVFYGLVLGVVGSLVLGLIPGLGVMWLLAGVLLAALAIYVAFLLQLRTQAAERATKVRFLPEPSTPEPAFLLRRSAN